MTRYSSTLYVGIKKALQIWNAKEVNILSEKETRILRPQDGRNFENKSLAKPRTTSAKPAPTPTPKTKK